MINCTEEEQYQIEEFILFNDPLDIINKEICGFRVTEVDVDKNGRSRVRLVKRDDALIITIS